jgi:mannose-6-phosphate isomerase-like protein (cupin superfamily)
MHRLGATILLGIAIAGRAQAPTDPTAFAASADVQAQVADMEKGMKPGQIFAWKPLVRAGASVAAIEIWKGAGKPAVHPSDAEYVIVVAGSGTLISGGTMADAKPTNPSLIEGSRIVGGTTRRLAPGDVFMIPAGVPHGFEVSGGKLALLGTKLPQPPKP